jgi:glutamate 5-kinase
VPIINENDTVAVEEIKFGDNDTLGVLVTHLAEGDLLILLTDTDGFFEEDPRMNPKAKMIHEVFQLDSSMEKSATASGSLVGTGGMSTKIQAAKSMMQSGIPMIIANGKSKNILVKVLNSEVIGTFFHPPVARMTSRKRWLAWSVKPQGEIKVDEGAQRAILEGKKSLLPTGVKEVTGNWGAGAIVKIVGIDGRDIAKGIVNYSSADLNQVRGLKTGEIREKWEGRFPEEAVHRDNMVKSEI